MRYVGELTLSLVLRAVPRPAEASWQASGELFLLGKS